MDGLSSTHRHTDDLRPVVLLGALTAALVGLVLALECVTACVLLVRRAQGALTLAASPGWLVVWMALAVALVAGTRLAVARQRHGNAGLAVAAGYLATAALILTALALTSFRAPLVVFFTWALVAAEEGAVWFVLRDGRSGTLGRLGLRTRHRWPAFHAPSPPKSGMPILRDRPHAETGSAPRHWSTDHAAALSAQFSQRLERVQSVGGSDMLSGSLTARFVSGQVTAHVHVAFCPPFANVPQLDFRQVAGPTARIKVGQVLPHGVRFDVKLEQPATDSASLCLEMRASHAAEASTLAPEGNRGSNQ